MSASQSEALHHAQTHNPPSLELNGPSPAAASDASEAFPIGVNTGPLLLTPAPGPGAPDTSGTGKGTEAIHFLGGTGCDTGDPTDGDLDVVMTQAGAANFGSFQFNTHRGSTPDDSANVTVLASDGADLSAQSSPGPSAPGQRESRSMLADAAARRSPAKGTGNASAALTTPASFGAGTEATLGADTRPETKPDLNACRASIEAPVSNACRASIEAPVSNACRASIEAPASDDGSVANTDRGGVNSLLDEPVSDEFGILLSRSADSVERKFLDGSSGGGGSMGPRQAMLSKEDRAGDAVPSWSELKTKAGKERKRLPLACIACRRKKIRCSGEKPACKHCLRSRTPCVYKVTARKAAPRTDYMAMLDKRLKRMEDRIIKIVPKADRDAAAGSASAATVTRSVVKPAMLGALANDSGSVSSGPDSTSGSVKGAETGTNGTGSNTTRARAYSTSKKRGVDEAFGPELDHWARDSAKNGPSDFARPSSIFLQQESEENKLFQEGLEALPMRELQEHLAEVFFDNIYGQAYHLLHKPSYMRKLKSGSLPPVLILSVCAVSARFSQHPFFGNGPNFLRGEEWAATAREIVTRRYEWPNITILTCLLILGLHEFGTCHGGRSWALGGLAIRMAFALQLHKDLERDPFSTSGEAVLSFVDREIRRRTMWACFLMDRFNSSGTDRPTFMKEESIKIQLPIKEKHFQYDIPGSTEFLFRNPAKPPSGGTAIPGDSDGLGDALGDVLGDAHENMGVAAYMVRAIAIWGRVIGYLNQGGKELDPEDMWSPESGCSKLVRQADEMLSGLPPSLVFTAENLHLHDTEGMANQFLFLHIAIQQNILFINRFAVSSPNSCSPQDVPKTFVTKAGAKAFFAANRISELLKEAENYLIAAPFVGYCAFLSSTVHIFGIFSGNPTMEATSKRNLATNVKFLSKMKRYWGMFHFMAENLRVQYRACADAARQGTPAYENANAASPIFQYGDWFDRYPHGVSSSDFSDPASYKKKERGDDAVLEQKPELHTPEELLTKSNLHRADSLKTGAASTHGGRPVAQAKRKSLLRSTGGSISSRASDQRSLEQPMAEVGSTSLKTVHMGQQQEQQRRQQSQQSQQPQRHQVAHPFAQSVGGQSGAPPPFNPQSRAIAAAAAGISFYPATIPSMSPLHIGSFSHQQQQQQQQQRQGQQHQQPPFYPPDLLALSSLSQSSHDISQLGRQLVFNAYNNGLVPCGDTAINGQSVLESLDWNGAMAGGPGTGVASGGQSTVSAGLAPPDSLTAVADAIQAYTHGHETSSAWFMPFDMQPPDFSPDMGGLGSLDQFNSIFGANMASQNGKNSGGASSGGDGGAGDGLGSLGN